MTHTFKIGDKVKFGVIVGTVVNVSDSQVEFQSDASERCIWIDAHKVTGV